MLERRLAATIHLASIGLALLAPVAAALVWGHPASPWLRRHIWAAFTHWAIVVALVVGAMAFQAANPINDFGVVRAAALRPPGYLSVPTNTAAIAWGASLPFAAVSARRALRGARPIYPFTMWWSAPQETDAPPQA
jgi:hypothetical protein